MYLSNIKLWNFRKYGNETDYSLKKDLPDLDLNFQKNLNVLIGSNDAGKTAIIDAIKLVLKTHSYDFIKSENFDFYNDSNRFRIELKFSDLTDDEAKNFVEWLGYEGQKVFLRLIYDVSRNDERIFPSEVKAGVDEDGSQMTAEAREYLKVTYLKPLRDAQNELVAKKNSRVSQILLGDEAFKGKEGTHYLIDYFKEFNQTIEKYFEGKDKDGNEFTQDEKKLGKVLKDKIDTYIKAFYEPSKESEFEISGSKLREILEKISIFIKDEKNLGLGTLNRLFMATELLHLGKEDYHGLKLGLIEELEAHLHPQAQMKVIERLQKEENKQLILTTHSPNLASKVKLNNLIICNNNKAFSMTHENTGLKITNYKYLERFLDTSKANLFFAKGVILVEGWAEELLIPSLAKRIGYDLTEKQVSVVNVSNTAFLRYVDIFKRKNLQDDIGVKVSVVTDLDLRPSEYAKEDDFIKKLKKYVDSKRSEIDFNEENVKNAYLKKHNVIDVYDASEELEKKINKYQTNTISNIKAFIAPAWTLEYCLAKSSNLRKLFFKSVLKAHIEQKIDEGKTFTTIKKYVKTKLRINTYFNNWTDSDEKIAFEIYWQILGNDNYVDSAIDEISKSIIAQNFARILENSNSIDFNEVKQDENVRYLCEAIEHACS
ncbi:ATP-dependent nuclease [Aliarcobacter butzleri]|uniref:ATP-dependent nuclease n=1 Tax=Aliarcobacter butzleri TaxID=28197 RepID=UPI003AF788EB